MPHVLLGDGAALTLLLLFLLFLLTEAGAELQVFCQPSTGFKLTSPGHPVRGVLRCAGDGQTQGRGKAVYKYLIGRLCHELMKICTVSRSHQGCLT